MNVEHVTLSGAVFVIEGATVEHVTMVNDSSSRWHEFTPSPEFWTADDDGDEWDARAWRML